MGFIIFLAGVVILFLVTLELGIDTLLGKVLALILILILTWLAVMIFTGNLHIHLTDIEIPTASIHFSY